MNMHSDAKNCQLSLASDGQYNRKSQPKMPLPTKVSFFKIWLEDRRFLTSILSS